MREDLSIQRDSHTHTHIQKHIHKTQTHALNEGQPKNGKRRKGKKKIKQNDRQEKL